MRVLGAPAFQCNVQPERIDAECDDAQQGPKQPLAPKLDTSAIKGEAVAIDHSMLDFPAVHQAMSEGPANAERAYGNQETKEKIANLLDEFTIKEGFLQTVVYSNMINNIGSGLLGYCLFVRNNRGIEFAHGKAPFLRIWQLFRCENIS